jgi:hypothetical protein
MQKTRLPYPKALSRLRKMNDSMRDAIGEDIEPRLRGMLQGHAEAAFTASSQGEPAGSNSGKPRSRKVPPPAEPVR